MAKRKKSFAAELNEQLNPTEHPESTQATKQDDPPIEEPKTPPVPQDDNQELSKGSRAGQYVRKTYTMSQETIDRVSAIADEYGIGRSELARHLLDWALNQVEDGSYTLPIHTKPTLDP